MTKLADLMNRQWLVASWEGYAIFWNHSATFNTYRIEPDGRAENVWCDSSYPPDGLSEAEKIRWAIRTARDLAEGMRTK